MRAGPLAMKRRELLGLGIAGALRRGLVAFGTGLAAYTVHAETYPSRPIRIVVGFVPGGSTDFGARLIAHGLTELLDTPVVVENRPGATGVIASEYVAKAHADGYTLLVGTATPIIIAPQTMNRPSFHPLKDLQAVNMVAETPMALAVNPRLGIRRLADLVALSRTRPVTVGTSGLGGTLHLLVETLIQSTGGNFVVVPYKGSGPTIADAVAGHIDATVSDVGTFLPMHETGKLVILGIASDQRMAMLPDVPVFKEDVPGLVLISWTGLFAPAHTPKPIVDALSAAMVAMTSRESVRGPFVKSGATVQAMANATAFQLQVDKDYERYGKLIRERGIVTKE